MIKIKNNAFNEKKKVISYYFLLTNINNPLQLSNANRKKIEITKT